MSWVWYPQDSIRCRHEISACEEDGERMMTWERLMAGTDPRMDVRFNDRAQRVVALAEDEARRLNHHQAGDDDLLRALIIEREGVAAKTLESLGVDLDDLLEHLYEHRGRAAAPPPAGAIPFSDSAKAALGLATQEAVYLGHRHVGTEHILLGLLREGGGAARILAQHGVNLHRASWRVQELLDQYQYGKRRAD
jgi:ATP-dependent Clp protease ATP-binding subunit ClpC